MEKKEWPKYRWGILLSNLILITILSMGLTTWSVAVPPLSDAFDLGTIQVLLGASLYVLGYTVGSGIWGRIIGPLGYKKTGLIGLTSIVIAQFAIPYIPNWYGVLIGRFFIGVGLIVVPLTFINGIWFPAEQRGVAQGILVGGMPLGFALGGVWTGFLEPILGWKETFSYFAILILVGAIQWALLTRMPPEKLLKGDEELEEEEEKPEKKEVKSVYSEVVTWLIGLVVFANFFQIFGMNSIAGVYLGEEGLEYGLNQVGTLVFALGIIGLLSTPLGGAISDLWVKKSPKKTQVPRALATALGGFLVATIGSFLVPWLAPVGFGVALISMVIVGWGIPWTNGPMPALPIDIFGAEKGGQALGAMLFIGGFGGVISPILAAWIGLNYGWAYAWYILGIGAFLGIIACWLIARLERE